MTERPDPALEPIWEVKERLWKEVEHLPLREAIRERLRRAQKAARDAGFKTLPSPEDEQTP